MDYRLRQAAEEKLRGEIGAHAQASPDKLAVALVYPNTYHIGMSNLGFQAIYGFLNDREDVYCERAFLPEPALFGLHTKTKTPICSLETQKPLAEFDVIAFSVSFENDYLHILKILELARISLLTEKRAAAEPLVLLGGAVASINPEPLAMFFDLCVIGDGEIVLGELIPMYHRLISIPARAERLRALATISGVYVPALYHVTYDQRGLVEQVLPMEGAPATIATCPLQDLNDYPAYSRILTEQTEFGDMFLLQISRGCPYQCRFCHTGQTQMPVRHLAFEAAAALVQRGLRYRETVGLIGSSITDYPYLQELCEVIFARNGKISTSSLRVNALRHDTYILDALARSGQKTITLAPEAGTERLQALICKGLSNDLLYDVVERIAHTPIPYLKLYYLIGLPTETDADLEAIITVAATCWQIVRQIAQQGNGGRKITLSVSPFVPKPFTPLQWCAMDSEAVLKQKIRHLSHALKRIGNVEVVYELPKWAVWQGILARGDRQIGQVLLCTLAYQGDWKKAFRELNLDPGFYAHRVRDGEEKLPWDHFNVGRSHQQLEQEYRRIANADR